MDITVSSADKRRKRLVIYLALGLGLGLAVSVVGVYGMTRIGPAAPEVSRDTIWIDQVRQGTLNRRVLANGVLVPATRRLLVAEVAGRVEEVHLLPGSSVGPDSPIVQLSNPDVEIEVLNARQRLIDAQSGLVLLRANLKMDRLSQVAHISEVRTRHLEARHRNEMNQELIEQNPGSISRLDEFRSEEAVRDLENRLEIENQRLAALEESIAERIRAQELQIANLEDVLRFHENRNQALAVTAGIQGQLIELEVEPGEWVVAGQELGSVIDPEVLGVEARVAEEFANDLSSGQIAEIRIGGEKIQGMVTRVDPAVVDGAISLEVSLPRELPGLARPNLRAEVTIEVDRIEDAVHVGRPTHWRNRDMVWAYRVDGNSARRIQLELGRRSYNEVEILFGAGVGEDLILTDLSQYGAAELLRVRD